MLRNCNRKEGIWDSNACASLVTVLVDAEEKAADENGYIPEHARVSGIDISFGEEQETGLSVIARNQGDEIVAETLFTQN